MPQILFLCHDLFYVQWPRLSIRLAKAVNIVCWLLCHHKSYLINDAVKWQTPFILCARGQKPKSKPDVSSSSPYASTAEYKPWPASINKLPRATTKWGTTSTMEMTEGHRVEENNQNNGLVSLHNLLCETHLISSLLPQISGASSGSRPEAQVASNQSSSTEILNWIK